MRKGGDGVRCGDCGTPANELYKCACRKCLRDGIDSALMICQACCNRPEESCPGPRLGRDGKPLERCPRCNDQMEPWANVMKYDEHLGRAAMICNDCAGLPREPPAILCSACGAPLDQRPDHFSCKPCGRRVTA